MNYLFTPSPGEVLADFPALRSSLEEWAPGRSGPLQAYVDADLVCFVIRGAGRVKAPHARENREQGFAALCQVCVPAGTLFQLENTGNQPLRFLQTTAPNSTPSSSTPPAQPQEPVLVCPWPGDKGFPRNERQRGGILVFQPNFECDYHSHDRAEEVFYFFEGEGDVTVEGQVLRVGPGDAVVTPADAKHKFKTFDQTLGMWLMVAPNLVPSHTFYKQLEDGSWERLPPKA
ncbi:MAG: cupin domain-containing protein [Candidatus Latescibacteria bacterium]|nr:cupin domain-containing protein [Candidatus Latescibacterota bacterium]